MLRYVKQQGVVLITVLLFFQLITMIGLYLLQTTFLSQKTNNTYWQHYALFLAANNQLRIIESSDLIESCHIKPITRVDLLTRPFNWWETHACIGKMDDVTYYYVVEPLNVNSCISHDRITLLAYSKNKVFREILQSVIVKLDNAKRDCAEDSDVNLGRQSWRRL